MKPQFLAYLLFLPTSLIAEVSVHGSPEEIAAFAAKSQSHVTLRGSASTLIEASKVTASVRLSIDGPTAGTTADLHERQKNELVDRLSATGILRGRIKVPKFAGISPRYGAAQTSIVGYIAESTLTIEVEEQKHYLDLLGAIDKTKGAAIVDLAYDHEQLIAIHKTIVAGACKRVLARKEAYEQNLGTVLRLVALIEEEGSERPERLDGSQFAQIPVKAAIRATYEVMSAPAGNTSVTPAGTATPSAPTTSGGAEAKPTAPR